MSSIAFFDSGVGGLPYLEAARSLLPDESFIYLADRAGFPYGLKTAAEVQSLVLRAIGELVARHDLKAVVIACNTATEIALETVRKAFPLLPIVGTVPAVKPAAALSKKHRIAVVATPRAVEDPYLEQLAGQWAKDCVLTRIGDSRLVTFVENDYIGSTADERLAAVRPSVEKAREGDVDVIVLGCTHFLHVAREFEAEAGEGMLVVDSRDGVAAQLRRVLETGPGLAASRKEEKSLFYITGKAVAEERYHLFARRFGLELAGSLYQ